MWDCWNLTWRKIKLTNKTKTPIVFLKTSFYRTGLNNVVCTNSFKHNLMVIIMFHVSVDIDVETLYKTDFCDECKLSNLAEQRPTRAVQHVWKPNCSSYLARTAWTQGCISPNPCIPVIVAISARFYPTGSECPATARRWRADRVISKKQTRGK